MSSLCVSEMPGCYVPIGKILGSSLPEPETVYVVNSDAVYANGQRIGERHWIEKRYRHAAEYAGQRIHDDVESARNQLKEHASILAVKGRLIVVNDPDELESRDGTEFMFAFWIERGRGNV